jgi:signal-transduction protein with cAMP-binding, CBS, and nucleotidyltransferase domain
MKKRARILTTEELNMLKQRYTALKFNNDFELVYDSQIPNTGIVLLQGQIALLKRKKVKDVLPPGTLLGVSNLINNLPMNVDCKLLGNSEVIMLNKSEILEALNNQDSELYQIIKEEVS